MRSVVAGACGSAVIAGAIGDTVVVGIGCGNRLITITNSVEFIRIELNVYNRESINDVNNVLLQITGHKLLTTARKRYSLYLC